MAESYCLKSCTECAREGCCGCKAGAFAQQCEIVKCCKAKNHESCGSCTNQAFCGTLRGRTQMPEKVFVMQRREAELAVKYRGDAELMARWVKVMFTALMVSLGAGLLGLIPALSDGISLVQFALTAVVCYCFHRMKPVDDGFGVISVMELVISAMYCVSSFVPENGFLDVVLTLIGAVCSFILFHLKCDTFRDALSGISRYMGEKWANQWKLYKISLYLLIGGLVFCIIPVIGFLGLLAVLGGVGVLLFVSIREYVYLWQTKNICEDFAAR